MDNVGPGPLVLAFVQDIVMRATYFYAKRMCLMYNVAIDCIFTRPSTKPLTSKFASR